MKPMRAYTLTSSTLAGVSEATKRGTHTAALPHPAFRRSAGRAAVG